MIKSDVFCRVIDNYGDIGVTYRLVRQLRDEFNWAIRLWVDKLASFKRIEPQIDDTSEHQWLNDIEVVQWDEETHPITPRDITIASFSCNLPDGLLTAMHSHKTLWINLDYLSAEDWVEGCHGLPSLRSDGLSSHFFFPGFTDKTGGLLRESALSEQRDHWCSARDHQCNFLISLGVDPLTAFEWRDQAINAPTIVSLFCYPQANTKGLTEALASTGKPFLVLLPEGIAPELASGWIGRCQLQRIPFVTQPDYDKILWTSDINFVRGEDSMVRALWAAKPLVWQIYPQEQCVHLIKLAAWLKLASLDANVADLVHTWNTGSTSTDLNNINFSNIVTSALAPESIQRWRSAMIKFSERQAKHLDLATSLVKFCEQSASKGQKG